MKKLFFWLLLPAAALSLFSCSSAVSSGSAEASANALVDNQGQSSVSDDVSQKDIVKVAAGSADHTTLVKAVKAADLVNSLSNAGPFTVFAPVNSAFEALPEGTLEKLMKPENKNALSDILEYHVTVSAYDAEKLYDGQQLGQVNGQNVTIHLRDGKIMVNDATILASVRASNGVVHVIDKVLLPQDK